MTAAPTISIFISTAPVSSDQQLLAELIAHLASLRPHATIWHPGLVAAGDQFDLRVADELARASVVLLLVSSDYLHNNSCLTEAGKALTRHKTGAAYAIPIILRPCDWTSTPWHGMAVLPTDGKPITTYANRDEAWTAIIEDIRKILKLGPVAQPRTTPGTFPPTQAYADPAVQIAHINAKSAFRCTIAIAIGAVSIATLGAASIIVLAAMMMIAISPTLSATHTKASVAISKLVAKILLPVVGMATAATLVAIPLPTIYNAVTSSTSDTDMPPISRREETTAMPASNTAPAPPIDAEQPTPPPTAEPDPPLMTTPKRNQITPPIPPIETPPEPASEPSNSAIADVAPSAVPSAAKPRPCKGKDKRCYDSTDCCDGLSCGQCTARICLCVVNDRNPKCKQFGSCQEHDDCCSNYCVNNECINASGK